MVSTLADVLPAADDYLHINANGDVRTLRIYTLLQVLHIRTQTLAWKLDSRPIIHGIS